MSIRFLAALLCFLVTVPGVWAQKIAEAEETIADRRTCGTFDSLKEHGFTLPLTLATDRDLYILVRQGAAYSDIRVLARTTVPAKRLAEDLAQLAATTKNVGLDRGTITYADNTRFHAAQLKLSSARLGATSGEQKLSVGVVVRGLEQLGYQPHALLAVPKYAQTNFQDAPPVFTGELYRWWDISRIPAEREVTVSSTLTPFTVWLPYLFLFFIPVVGMVGILVAQWVAQAPQLPLERRRALYMKLALWPTFGAMALHAPFALWTIRSPELRQVVDLWFGSISTLGSFSSLLMLGPLMLVALLPLAARREKQLYGNTTAKRDLAPDVVAEAERVAAVKKRVALLPLIPLVLGGLIMILGWTVVPLAKSQRFIPTLVGMLIAHGGAALLRYRSRDTIERVDPVRRTHDLELEGRLKRQASAADVALGRVFIDESATGRTEPRLKLTSGELEISRRMLDILTPAQLEFVVVREILEQQSSSRKEALPFFLPAFVVMGLPPLLMLSGVKLPLEPYGTLMLLVVFLCIGSLFVFLPVKLRKQALAADQATLRSTRNLKAAESALVALAENAALPYLEESPAPLSTKPALQKRLNALRQAAATLGLR